METHLFEDARRFSSTLAMVWLEARHVHDPGQPLHEALEQYVPEVNMSWPLARSMYAALACEQAESTATSYTLDGVVAMLKTSRGQDKMAWTIAQSVYDGSTLHVETLAPLAIESLTASDAPLEQVLNVLTLLCQSEALSSLWERFRPMQVVSDVLLHSAFDRVPLPCKFAFFVRFLDAMRSPLSYDEALKLIIQHLLEHRQHAHFDESVRGSAFALGALVLEDRLNKALEAALAHPTHETCIMGDASLSLVLNLYAVTLMGGSMSSPRLVRPLGLALVYDVIKTVNACLYISRTSQYVASTRKQYAQEKVFLQLLEEVGSVPTPVVSEHVWKQVSLALGSDESHLVPRVLRAYFLHALSIIAPFYPAPVPELHVPKPLENPPSKSYDTLCARISASVTQTRNAMIMAVDAFTAALNQNTLADMPTVCISVLPSLCASPCRELAHGANAILRTLSDASYTRFESMHMLWLDAREPAVYGARHYVSLFLLAAHHLSWSLSLARASVSLLDDMLHVLCDRNMGVLLPYIPWDAGSGADVLHVWTGISECIAAMFGRIPEWSRTADRQEMLQWIAHVPMLASYMVQSADLASRSNELQSYTDQVYGALAWPLDCAIGWLRLNHEELLQQLSDYIRRTVRVFKKQQCLMPGPVVKHAVEFLGQQLAVTNAQQRKTLLSTPQMELLLDEFIAFSRASAPPATKKQKLLQQTLSFAPRPLDAQKKKPIVVDLTRDSPKTAAPKQKSTGKLAQLRNEFQLTRAVARKPQAPLRQFEPDEPRAPLAISSVTGAVKTLPPVKRPPPPEDSSSSSEDEDEEEGLAALASPRKSKAHEVRRSVKPMVDPALQEAMRKAEDEQRRRRLAKAPALTPMHECILSWDMQAKGGLPPTRLDGLPFSIDAARLALTDTASYMDRFCTLLTLEAWAQFQQACGDVRDAVSVPLQYTRQSRVDNFVHLEWSTQTAVPVGTYFNETDIVYLELPTRAIRLTANVLFSKRASTTGPATINLGVQCVCTKAQHAMPYMHEAGWKVTKLLTLTTLRREFAALCSVPDLAMAQDVLHARVAQVPDVSKADEVKAMQSYQLNAPQARAVVAAMRTLGFSLIRGPPGTGKTKTIRALVASFLSRRAGTTIGSKKASTPQTRMLLCAPSNAAIDELVIRIKDGVEIDGKRILPRLVRLGRDEAVHPNVRDVTLDALVEKAGGNAGPSRAMEELQQVEQAWREKRAQLELASASQQARTLQAELNELTDRRFELREQVSSLQSRNKMGALRPGAEHHMARMSILDDAEIVCTTLAGAGHEMLYRYTFDTVVIDEAAQTVEPSTLIPLRYECMRCIMVGDPKQLPPTVLSQEAQRLEYDQSLFVRMFNAAPERVHLLSIQYRMHPDISLFPSTAFYDKQLVDGPQMTELTAQPWHGTALFGPFRFFDVRTPEEPGRSHSLQNPSEAQVAMQVYEALCACAGSSLRDRIGFVSMYKAQVELLKTLFTKRYGRSTALEVDFSSVDGFQGQEKDIIVISCVRSNKDGNMGFLTDYRRLNVALTRARSNMIVIGNADMLCKDKIWRTLITEARSFGFVVPVDSRTFENPQRPAPKTVVSKPNVTPKASSVPKSLPASKADTAKASTMPVSTHRTPKQPATDKVSKPPTPISAPTNPKSLNQTSQGPREPPRVVPSASLLAPPKRKHKTGKWAQIVERNKASKPETPTPTPRPDRRPPRSNDGPSWLRSARPHTLQKRNPS